MTAIEVRVYSGADPSQLLAVLDRTRQRQWTDALNDVGAGSFSVWALHPKIVDDPTLIDYGNIVRFALDDVEVFAFVIEKKTTPQVAPDEDAGRWIKVQGRGVLSLLEAAVVYPVGGLGGAAERDWLDATAGQVMDELLSEAFDRGALPGVTQGFSDGVGSDGDAFTGMLDIAERAGTDLLQVAQRHVELAIDVYMTPDLELRYFNHRGVNRTTGPNPVTLRIADQLAELAIDGEGVIKNALLIEGPAGFIDRENDDSVTTYGRREGFLALGNARTSTQLTRAADRVFRVQASPVDTHTASVLWEEGTRPYVDYDVGDTIIAPSNTNSRLSERVRAITISEDDEGRIEVRPDLAGRKTEFEARLARWMKSISGGTLGGAAAAASSPTSDPGTDAAIDNAIADHAAGLPHFDEISDLADVDAVPVNDGDVLTYDDGVDKWVASPPRLPPSALVLAASVQWAAQPAAVTELDGTTAWRMYADLSDATEVRLVATVGVVGAPNAKLRGQYSTNDGGSWSNLAASGSAPEVAIGSAGAKKSAWAAIAGSALAEVLLRVVGESGNAVASPEVSNVALQFK